MKTVFLLEEWNCVPEDQIIPWQCWGQGENDDTLLFYERIIRVFFLVWRTGSPSTRGKSGSEASVASRKEKSLWTLWAGRAHSLETFRPQ